MVKMARPFLNGKALLKYRQQFGFTFIGLMMIITISGIALAGIGIVWSQQSQRANEAELLYIGNQYRKAIESYYNNPPPPLTVKEFPTSLQSLATDERFAEKKHHIRQLYTDPIAYGKPFELIKKGERIVGIYSSSTKKPIKKTGFPKEYAEFTEAKTYQEWKFFYSGPPLPIKEQLKARPPR